LHPGPGFATLRSMEPKPDDRTLPSVPTPFLAAGVALLLAGLGIGGFIALEVYGLYRRVEDNAFVSVLGRRFADADLVVIGGEPLTVTAEGATVLAIALFVVLALLGIHIATAFMRTGAHIVYPVFPHQLTRLRQRIDGLQRRLAGR